MKPKIKQKQVQLPEAEFEFGSGLSNRKLQGNKIGYMVYSMLRERKKNKPKHLHPYTRAHAALRKLYYRIFNDMEKYS